MATAPTPESDTNQGGADLSDTSEFDEAFAVAAAPEAAPADDAAAPKDAPADEGQDGGSQSGDADQAKPDDQAGAAGEEPPASGSDVEDIWTNADPKLKAAFDAAIASEKHRFASVAGRLSAADRRLAQIQREQDSGGRQEGGEASGGAAVEAASPGLKALLETDEMKAARRDYGEVLNPLLGVVEKLVGEIETLRGSAVGAVDEGQGGAAIEPPDAVQVEALTGLVPDWASLAGDQRLGPWLNTQPAHVRKAAEENWDRIVDGAVAADVFLRFKAAHNIGAAAPAQDGGGTGDRRERQKQGARAAGVSGPTAASGEADDFDTAFTNASRKQDLANRRT